MERQLELPVLDFSGRFSQDINNEISHSYDISLSEEANSPTTNLHRRGLVNEHDENAT